MNDYPIKLGSMLFTMVDPNPGHEVAYNRWYERDHFYAGCMVGPWLFAGKRWVATRALKDLRFPDDSAVAQPTDAGSYLAIYWVLADHHKDHFDWAVEQVQYLYANNRGFGERKHAHTVLLDKPWSFYRDADPVPIELALDHPYQGLGVIAIDRADGVDEADLRAFLTSDALPALMGDGVASMVSFGSTSTADGASTDAPMDLGTPAGGPERGMQLFFLDAAPDKVWDRFRTYADTVNESGLAKVVFGAPFLPTIVGTDTYTDQLW